MTIDYYGARAVYESPFLNNYQFGIFFFSQGDFFKDIFGKLFIRLRQLLLHPWTVSGFKSSTLFGDPWEMLHSYERRKETASLSILITSCVMLYE